MTSLILKFVDSPKTQTFKYLESETYINAYNIVKKRFIVEITFKV